jgi:hypothetical protein
MFPDNKEYRTSATRLILRSSFFSGVVLVGGALPTFRENLSVPSSIVKQSKTALVCRNQADWTKRLSRNVGKQLSTYAVEHSGGARTSTIPWRKAWNHSDKNVLEKLKVDTICLRSAVLENASYSLKPCNITSATDIHCAQCYPPSVTCTRVSYVTSTRPTPHVCHTTPLRCTCNYKLSYPPWAWGGVVVKALRY